MRALEDAITSGAWSPESKTVPIHGEDTDWGRGFGNAIREQFENAGWETVSKTHFLLELTEFYPSLNEWSEMEPPVMAGTSTAAPSLSAFIKQADEVGLESLIIDDGVGWIGECYKLTGDGSNYVLSQIPRSATQESRQFAEHFQEQWDMEPSPSAARLAYDCANFFIETAQQVYEETDELSKERMAACAKDRIQKGTPWATRAPRSTNSKRAIPYCSHVPGQRLLPAYVRPTHA